MPTFSLKNAARTQISFRSSITIHFCTGVTPAAYRLDAFRKNYRKGGLIGTYVYLAFQKPFRESPSSGTSHSRSRGKLHDRNGKTAAAKIPRSAGDAARLCTHYHLPSSRDGAECHHDLQKDSLVGGNSKRMMLTPLSSSCVGSDSRRGISPSLTTPNFSVKRRMMSSPPSKAAFPLALPVPLSAPYGDSHRASYAKTQKESQDPRNRKSSPRNAPRHRPCHQHHALWQ